VTHLGSGVTKRACAAVPDVCGTVDVDDACSRRNVPLDVESFTSVVEG
jgi:hypothetical protein